MGFTIVILGRPNVGKSTLFNRLTGRRAALVHPSPGVTRDRREGEARLSDLRFTAIDTAGLDDAPAESVAARMQRQTEAALAEADLALLMIDARAGVTPLDQHFADWLRKAPTPVILLANKCEARASDSGFIEAYALGLGDPVAVSAEHGQGMDELRDRIAEHAPHADADAEDAHAEDADAEGSDAGLIFAIVGRPNVGKSTLANRLLREERVITGPEPGLTRDAIAVDWEYKGMPVRLVDTAGLRRHARVSEKLESLAVADAFNAIRFANVVVLVLDAESMLEKQDLTIAREVVEEGRALVIAVNKWDLVRDRQGAMRRLVDRLETSLPQVRGISCVTFSALTGHHVERLMPAVLDAYAVWNRRAPTGPLNRWLADVVARHPPPIIRGRRLKLRYITQVKSRPPTFAIFTTRPAAVPEAYRRYLSNGLRETFALPGVPIRIVLRKGPNPYSGEEPHRTA